MKKKENIIKKEPKFIKEFKEFALQGNVMDMAIGIVIGGAFGKIVASLVSDMIMPVIGYVTAGVNFAELKLILSKAKIDAHGEAIPEIAIMYGSFIQTIINFIIIALSIFIMIKFINKARNLSKPEEESLEAEAPPIPTEADLLTEIRDLLKK